MCSDFDLASIPTWSRSGSRSRSRMHTTRYSIIRSCLGFNFCMLCGFLKVSTPQRLLACRVPNLAQQEVVSFRVRHLVDIDIKTKSRASSLSPAALPQSISYWSALSPGHCHYLRCDKIADGAVDVALTCGSRNDLRLDRIANPCPMYPSHLPGDGLRTHERCPMHRSHLPGHGRTDVSDVSL